MRLGFRQCAVAVGALVHQKRPDIAVQRHLALRRQLGRQRVNRDVDAVPAHPQRSGARVGQRNDRLAMQMVRCEQRTHRDRLVDAREGHVGEVGVQFHVLGFFGFEADVGHFDDGLQRIAAGGGFGRGHHRVGAVQHGVGHVADFGAGRHRVVDHRLHHVGRGDHHLVQLAGHLDHAFLQGRNRGVADLHGQVTAGDHDAVAGPADGFKIGNRLGPFDLGDQPRLVPVLDARHVAQLTRHLHVGGGLGETDRHVIGLETHRRTDVLHVLSRERRRREAAALLVDALVVGQLAALLDRGAHLLAMHCIHRQHDQTVVEKQHVAGLHVSRQLLVVETDACEIPRLGTRGVEHELHARFQIHLALGELADADLRALQIGHDRHLAACPLRCLAHQFCPVDMVLRLAMAEVQPHHVDAGADHLFEQRRIAGGGAESGDNLGGTGDHESDS